MKNKSCINALSSNVSNMVYKKKDVHLIAFEEFRTYIWLREVACENENLNFLDILRLIVLSEGPLRLMMVLVCFIG